MTHSSATTEPRLLICGTGRCGTLTYARLLGGAHEQGKTLMIPLTPRWLCGAISDQDAADMIRSQKVWQPVEADRKFTVLLPLLDAMYRPRWLWLIRRPEAAVASMVGKHWYLPSDDELLPVSLAWPLPTVEQNGTNRWQAWTPPAAHRVTAPLAGEASLKEWRTWPQHVRCAWWWDWCCRRMLTLAPKDRLAVLRLEDRTPNATVAEWAGVECGANEVWNWSVHPRLDAGQAADVRAICGTVENMLYPPKPGGPSTPPPQDVGSHG